jgi:5-aminolevulinate synthase
MINYKDVFTAQVNKIKSENRYRNFVEIIRDAQNFPYAINTLNNMQIILWCINDYLGMSANPKVIEAAINATNSMGVGSGGTRNICGSHAMINKLESLLSKLHDKERALIFTSGYVANDTTLDTLAKILPNLVYFSDEQNHASMIQGIKRSGAEKHVYKHNDVASLESLLKSADPNRPKIIVFESVYSMDGIISPMKEICQLAKKYNCLTYLDEVHSVGLYGPKGAGIAEALNLQDEIDILQGTLAKGFGTIGGYISAKAHIIDAVRSSASGFIFTTSIPPSIAAASIASIEYLMSSSKERTMHQQVVAQTKAALTTAGIKFIENNSHIVSVVIGDPVLTKAISERLLLEYGIYIQHINFPTVKAGTERLRITPTPFHTPKMIEHLVQSLTQIYKDLNIAIG